MELSERRCNMLYKNSLGGSITVRIALPRADEGSDVERLYSRLVEKYMEAARDYIERREDSAFFVFSVSYTKEENAKYIKINRRSDLSSRGATAFSANFIDTFKKRDMRLKS